MKSTFYHFISGKSIHQFFRQSLGPGLVTGASDDDPSGIATYSQVGAQLGYSLLWIFLFSYPLLAVTQEISARIGRVTGRGLAGNIRYYYSPWLLRILVFLLFGANLFNLVVDIGAMGAVVTMLEGGSKLIYATLLALISLALFIFLSYHRYEALLKWFTLVLFAYVIAAFIVRPSWPETLRHVLIPSFSWRREELMAIVAVFGTTISPYLFFWQASEEAEAEEINLEEKPLKEDTCSAPYHLHRIRVDTNVGMAFAQIIAFFIMLTVAATLHERGVYDIQTPAQAAEALKPIAGKYAFELFALGIIGTGMLAVPALAGSAAYAIGETLNWPVGLERKPLHAKGFYGILIVAIVCGTALNFIQFNPIRALFWAALINGVAAGPIMLMMMLMASNPKLMGELTISPWIKYIGWIATLVMLACSVALFINL